MTESVETSVSQTAPELPEAYRGVKHNFELLTPAWSVKTLETQNGVNRPANKAYLRKLCNDLTSGTYLITHQGIAFDAAGNLLDGQHRLKAIALTGISAWMVVSRGWPNMVRLSNGSSIPTFSALDVPGNARTVSTFLHSLGVANEKAAGNICFGLVSLAQNYRAMPRLTNSLVKRVFDSAQDSITAIAALSKTKGIVQLPKGALSCFTWAHTVNPESTETLARETIMATSAEATPARMLAFGIQNIGTKLNGPDKHAKTMHLTSDAIQMQFTGEMRESLRGGEKSMRWLVSQNKALRSTIEQIMQENSAPTTT